MEGMAAWKHVESLSQQSTFTDLASSIRLNDNTPAKQNTCSVCIKTRRIDNNRVALLVSDVLYVGANVFCRVSGSLHLRLEVINVSIVVSQR